MNNALPSRLRALIGKLQAKAKYRLYNRVSSLYPAGHFYSPVNDTRELTQNQGKIWTEEDEMPGIQWDAGAQLKLLESFKKFTGEIVYPMEANAAIPGYYYANDQFPMLDAEVLYCMLRNYRPARMIEIGSGFSSLITADVNCRKLNKSLDFTCIEPYPRKFLSDGIEGISRLLIKKVEEVDLDVFASLGAGDFLFIDSSHVSKVGSDVNHLFFKILPTLSKGVVIHLHDIFLPDEYPKKWVLDEGRSWNEQYLLRAFLQFNSSFQVVWGSHFMATRFPEQVKATFPRFPALGAGGSIWIQRTS